MVLLSAQVQRGWGENPSKALLSSRFELLLLQRIESFLRLLRLMAKGQPEASSWPLGSSCPETGGMFPLALSLAGVSVPPHEAGVGFIPRGAAGRAPAWD